MRFDFVQSHRRRAHPLSGIEIRSIILFGRQINIQKAAQKSKEEARQKKKTKGIIISFIFLLFLLLLFIFV
jgi:hypothetical protein